MADMDIKQLAETIARDAEACLVDELNEGGALAGTVVKAVVLLCVTRDVGGEPGTMFSYSVGDSHMETLGLLEAATALVKHSLMGGRGL